MIVLCWCFLLFVVLVVWCVIMLLLRSLVMVWVRWFILKGCWFWCWCCWWLCCGWWWFREWWVMCFGVVFGGWGVFVCICWCWCLWYLVCWWWVGFGFLSFKLFGVIVSLVVNFVVCGLIVIWENYWVVGCDICWWCCCWGRCWGWMWYLGWLDWVFCV